MTRKEIAGLVLGTALMSAPVAMAAEGSAKCGAGKCGGNKKGSMEMNTTTAKCGAMKTKTPDANKEKMVDGKCGSKK